MPSPTLTILTSRNWIDYELLDSGGAAKLERYGAHLLIRPEHQAVWKRGLPEQSWEKAAAVFQPTQEESGGYWKFRKAMPESWTMHYGSLEFKVALARSRHLGMFPEQAVHWDWISSMIQREKRPIRVLNLFGYTGLASLAAVRVGATVTHLDASKKAIAWAKENQALSGLSDRPIRWLVDDAMKFIQREARRGSQYEGLILDPPKFGRGPAGQVWEFFETFPELLAGCRQVLSRKALFVVITAYAIRSSALSISYALEEMMDGIPGEIAAGELALEEKSLGRLLSMALFARWQANEPKGGII
jgi:23S rRNA (cytosine1962-C5)-methyltransferase